MRIHHELVVGLVCGLALLSLGCGPEVERQGAALSFELPGRTAAVFDTDARLEGRSGFFRLPWPSDLRLTPEGALDVAGYPLAFANEKMASFRLQAAGQVGTSVLPTIYFQFTGALRARSEDEVLTGTSAPLLLIQLPEAAEARAQLIPVVAGLLAPDAYVPDSLLAMAPRPGFVLRPGRTYAAVVRRGVQDVWGQPLRVHPVFQALARGERPPGARGEELVESFRPVFASLDALGVPREDVAVATTFTTGDRLAELAELAGRVRAHHRAHVSTPELDASTRLENPRYCFLTAEVELPQFQRGRPVFDREGLFEVGPDGLPTVQRHEVAKLSLTLPRSPMPADGYPLALFFHGSGGRSRYAIDGNEDDAGLDEVERRPAYQLAGQGVALAAASLPLSPDRVAGASAFAYVNLNNPVAMRDTFRQGVLESGMLLDALAELRIPAAHVAACTGASLPPGASDFRFDTRAISVQGQSMGGMYANLFSAVDPRVVAVVPTAAGGFWAHFAFHTSRIPVPSVLMGLTVGAGLSMSWLHPAMSLIEQVWEVIDPIAAAPRLARQPLPGHPARHVYQPVGDGDSYFSRATFEAMTLAYGHTLAGQAAWPEMLDALALAGLETPAEYPVAANMVSANGSRYTGVSVQLPEVAGDDGHSVYLRIPAVRHQYRCFHRAAHARGVGFVPAPGDEATACD